MKVLVKNGFVYNEEIKGWENGDWCICKDGEYVKELVEGFYGGCRICWMNRRDYVEGSKYVLVNNCDDGVWICKSVYECLRIMKYENENWYGCEEDE